MSSTNSILSWNPGSTGLADLLANLWPLRKGIRHQQVTVSYVAADGQVRRAKTQNLGASGAFILTADPETQGTRILVEIEGPHGALTLSAEVRWTSRFRHAPGMGIQWIDEPVWLSQRLAGLGE